MNQKGSILDKLKHHIINIDKELDSTFNSDLPLIKKIGKHSLLSEGKRIRPLLFVISSFLCGYEGNDIYQISTMFEYIHCASLLHDDVIDNADMRRKKPSASYIWGNTAAVLAGDYLSTIAASIAIDTNNMEILRITTQTGNRMIEGQFLELIHTNDWSLDKDTYMQIITLKTAELMSVACSCGGMISGAGKELIECLNKFGLNLGIAFQLIDDLLDYESSVEKFGKPVGKDIKEGKITLPLIYCLSEMEKKDIERYRDLFRKSYVEDKTIQELISCVRKSNAIEMIRKEAKEYVDKASEMLDIFPASTYKSDIIALNEYIAVRQY